MSEILALGSPDSVLGFTRRGGGDLPEWDRFLTLDGADAYHLGNICNSCEVFFERLGDGQSDADLRIPACRIVNTCRV